MPKKKFDLKEADMLRRKELRDRGFMERPSSFFSETLRYDLKERTREEKMIKDAKQERKTKVKKVKVKDIKEGYVISYPGYSGKGGKYAGKWLVSMVERELLKLDKVILLTLESFGRRTGKKIKLQLIGRALSNLQDVKVVHHGTLRKVEKWVWQKKFF